MNRTGVVIKKKTALGILSIGLLVFIASVGFWLMPIGSSDAEEWSLVVFSWLGVMLLAWSLATWYMVRRETISPYTVFLCCSYLFMFGQSFLWAFGVKGMPDLRDSFPAYQIARAQLFTLLALGFFHVGALCSASGRSSAYKPSDSGSPKIYKCIRIVGWALFAISVIPFGGLMMKQVMLTRLYGYGALYDPNLARAGFAAVGNNIAQFFVPSLICLFVGYRTNRFVLFFVLVVMAARVAIAFYVGGRSPAMVMVLCAICMWHYFVKRITLRKGLLLILLGYLLVSILPAIAAVRSEAGRDLQTLVMAFGRNVGKNEQFVKAISEMGGSMFPLIQTMNIVPFPYPFRYGGSYLYSFFSLVPNLGFWEAHPAFLNANLGDWLQKALGLGYGPGFSPAAEAYINFGWGGIFAMFALGILYGRAFTLADKDTAPRRPASAIFIFVILSLALMTTRNSFIATVRAVFYYAMPIYVAVRLLDAGFGTKRTSSPFGVKNLSCGDAQDER